MVIPGDLRVLDDCDGYPLLFEVVTGVWEPSVHKCVDVIMNEKQVRTFTNVGMASATLWRSP